jgi:hypothetical protein
MVIVWKGSAENFKNREAWSVICSRGEQKNTITKNSIVRARDTA